MKNWCAALLVAFSSAAACYADDAGSKWAGYGSVGVATLPDYDGSKSYEMLPYLEARLNYANYYARFDGGELRFNILNDDTFHVGPLVGFRRGRGSVESAQVGRLAHFDDTVTAGGFVEWEHVAGDPRWGESLTVSAGDAVNGAPSGWEATLRAEARMPVEAINPGFIVSVEADTSWSSHSYLETYFGISPSKSLASGLPAFSPSSGLSQWGVAFCVDQFLSRHWSVGLRTHYGRLINDAEDSPVTSKVGSPDQYFLGAVVGYVL